MSKSNESFGVLFATGTALVSPMHEIVTQKPLYRSVTSSTTRRSSPHRLIRRLIAALERWRQHRAERRALAVLDDRLLCDVGLTRADVEDALRRRFWH